MNTSVTAQLGSSGAQEPARCTLCSSETSSGFYTGCMVKDGHAPEWDCDGKGNLTRRHSGQRTDDIAAWLESEAEDMTNSLHCGDSAMTIHGTHQKASELKSAARYLRGRKPSFPSPGDTAPCPRCHYNAGPEGAERYWEARWRDEKAENDRLASLVEGLPDRLLPKELPAETIAAIVGGGITSDQVMKVYGLIRGATLLRYEAFPSTSSPQEDDL